MRQVQERGYYHSGEGPFAAAVAAARITHCGGRGKGDRGARFCDSIAELHFFPENILAAGN